MVIKVINLVKNTFGILPVRHPDILSGMGIATNELLDSESSVFSNEMLQFLFEQSIL